MRRGVTLIEALIVLSVFGIIAGIGLPRAHGVLERIAVDAAAQRIRAAHARAGAAAVLAGRVTLLELGADSIRIRMVSGTDTTVVWSGAGPAADGATLSGPPHALVYSPLGLTLGLSNGTWRVTCGAAARDVVISRLGRLRIQ